MSGSLNTASRWTPSAPRWTWCRRRPAIRKPWSAFRGYQGVIYSHGHYQLHTFDQLPDLVGVIAPTVGVDHVDIQAATAAGVVVGNIPTFATEQTADIALYLMLGAVRRIPRILSEWAAGHRGIAEWERRVDHIGDMRASTLALIGLGRIGRAVAVRAQAFGTRCIAYAPTVSPWEAQGLGVELVGLHEAVEQADIVSVHLPYTPGTHHFVDADLLARMKPTAVLINVSRGPIVDEAALVKALESGAIAAAGVDVFESEPPMPETPLLKPAERDLDAAHRGLHLGERAPRGRGGGRADGLDCPGVLAPGHLESRSRTPPAPPPAGVSGEDVKTDPNPLGNSVRRCHCAAVGGAGDSEGTEWGAARGGEPVVGAGAGVCGGPGDSDGVWVV